MLGIWPSPRHVVTPAPRCPHCNGKRREGQTRSSVYVCGGDWDDTPLKWDYTIQRWVGLHKFCVTSRHCAMVTRNGEPTHVVIRHTERV